MTQLKHFSAGLMALGVSLALQGGAAAATDTAPAFRILSDQEIAAHSAMMNSLRGEARNEYRNAQYEQLKQRALDNGFRLPDTPPWAAQAAAGPAAIAARTPAEPVVSLSSAGQPENAVAAPAEDAAAEAAARHAAMREKLQAQQPAPSPNTDPGLENLKQMVSAQQRQVDAGRAAVHEAAPAVAPQTPAAPAVSADEPRFAPVEEITAAQAVAPQPAPAEAPPAAPESPAAPPTAAAPPMPPAPPAPPTPATPPAPVAGPPGPYPTGPETQAAQAPAAAADSEAAAAGEAAVPATEPVYGDPNAMDAYRESMRTRFDEYMKERQAQYEETMRRQREQHEAQMEQRRANAGLNRPQPPYPYPAMPAYGPRYPAAFPGYRTPYWQQPQQ